MTSIQKDSLLNEYKGNLFEFLVAQKLSQKFSLEASFLSNLGQDFFDILSLQEKFLNDEYSFLLRDLPLLASQTANEMIKTIPFEDIKEILLIGKKAAASGDDRFFECDLLLKGKKDYPISLKLSKKGAFVNTKSAGLKSFLKKYFFKLDGEKLQTELNNFVDVEFEALARKLYDNHELEFDKSFEAWKKEDLPVRPGELNEEDRKSLHEYYHKLNSKLYSLVLNMYESDMKVFSKSLAPLVGHGHAEMIQVSCYYESKPSKYELQKIEFQLNYDQVECVLLPLKSDIGNFVIDLKDKLLQIRIKPMKTFIQPSFKINCSVKSI